MLLLAPDTSALAATHPAAYRGRMSKRDENDELDEDLTPEERAEEDVAPEEEELEGWLPEPEPTDGPAPAP